MAKKTFACRLTGRLTGRLTHRLPYQLPHRLRLVSSLIGGGLLWGATLSQTPTAIAQVNNADLACYLNGTDGRQYDLSELCGGFNATPTNTRSQEVTLQTGDVQVTLRWEGDADLDLSVEDPDGSQVSFSNPAVPSGGQLDVDANAGCFERMAAPVENIFWPTGGGATGDYMAIISLFSSCTTTGSIDYSLDILTHGQVQNHTGTVSTDQPSARVPFSLGEVGAAPIIEETTGGSLPPVPGQ